MWVSIISPRRKWNICKLSATYSPWYREKSGTHPEKISGNLLPNPMAEVVLTFIF
jgi:hypothetical protein